MTKAAHEHGGDDKVLTKFESVAEVAYFLALKWIWNKIPTMEQIKHYCRGDGAYFCAIDGCEIVRMPQLSKDNMVTMGPLVFCHDHGREVLRSMRRELGVEDERLQWHFLSKTLHNVQIADDRAARQAAEDGKENRRATSAAEEIETRWARLNEARDWGPRHADYIARNRIASEETLRPPVTEQLAVNPQPSPPTTPATESRDPLETMDLPEVQDQLAALETLRRAMGDAQYAQMKAKLLARLWALEDTALAKQRRKENEALARLGKAPGEAEVQPAVPASQPGLPAAQVLQRVSRQEPPRPAPRVVQDSHHPVQSQNGAAAGTSDEVVAFARKIRDGVWIQRADKRGASGAMEYQCVVARNRPHACSTWGSAEQMKIIRGPNGEVFFGICNVCAAIARAAGVEIGDTTLEQAFQALRPATERGGAVEQIRNDPARRRVRMTGKTARTRAKRMRKAADRGAAAKEAAVVRAVVNAGKLSKEERKRARGRK